MRAAMLALMLGGAAAHTNLVGFDMAPNGDDTARVTVFFGTYHSGAVQASGAIALYRCDSTDATTAAECPTEAYGQTSTGITSTMTVDLQDVGSIKWKDGIKTQNSLATFTEDHLGKSGFRVGKTLFADLEVSKVYNVQMGTVNANIPCDNTAYLVDYDSAPAAGVTAKSALSADWAPCLGGCGAFKMSDIIMTIGDTCEITVEGVESAAAAFGDPHLALPHGGRADFRGEHKSLYNFLSYTNLSLNVMTEFADFELHAANHTRHKLVHGSFLTQAHIVARTSSGKKVRTSFYADKISQEAHVEGGSPINYGWANGTIDSEKSFTLAPNQLTITRARDGGKEAWPGGKLKVDDVTIEIHYSSLHVTTPEFEIVITPMHFTEERNVVGLHHRLDVQIKPRVAESEFKLPPHGIIGQGWDGDDKAVDGEQDTFPKSGEFTTYALAKGAIEGTPNDYKVATKWATDFKFSRFDSTKAIARDVAALVAAGELNQPKTVATATGGQIGSTEYNFSKF